MLRLIEWEDGLCKCGCGQPVVKSRDKALPWKVDTFTCYAGRALDRVKREAREAADQQKRPEGWDDGTYYYVTAAKETDMKPQNRPTRMRGERGN